MNNLRLIKISKILLYLMALTPIIFWQNFIFPYITLRTIFFRIIISIIFILFLYLILEKKIKIDFTFLKKNYFFWIFVNLLIIEFLAAIFGKSFLFSVFSSLERMWGIYTVFNLFLFYFFCRAFFNKNSWIIFFNTSFAVSLLVSFYGIIQRFPSFFHIPLPEAGVTRIPSTLGNPTYVAIYLLFNIAFALYFFIINKNKPVKFFYLAVIIIDFFSFVLADMRGTYLGLLGGIIVAMLIYIICGRNNKFRFLASFLILLGVIISALAVFNPNSSLIKKAPILNKISTISFSATTAQTRVIGWKAALKGVGENPFLGAGMENYNIIFNKYFPASYYNLAPTESYFDRAHNQYFNIAAESGILALLVYLCFYFILAFYLIRGYKKEKISLSFFIVFAGIASAYFIHLFFVFDDLNSFLFFVALIAFVEYSYYEKEIISPEGCRKISLGLKIIIWIFILGSVFAIYKFNYQVLKAANLGARAQNQSVSKNISKDISAPINYYNKSIEISIVPKENLILDYVNYLIGLSNNADSIKANPELNKKISAAIANVKEKYYNSVKKKPDDAFYYIKIAQLNDLEYLLSSDNKYIEEALNNLNKALSLSPERLQVYYILGETYNISGNPQKAIETLNKAIELNPNFAATYYYLGRAYLGIGDFDKAYDLISSKAINEMGYVPAENSFILAIADHYVNIGNLNKAIQLYQQALTKNPNDQKILASLTVAYIQKGDGENAKIYALKAKQADPQFGQEADIIIKMIDSGQISELQKATK